MHGSTLSLTSALDVGGWSTPRPCRFTPTKGPVPVRQQAGWDQRPVWKGPENLAPTPTGTRFSYRQCRSVPQCRLSYRYAQSEQKYKFLKLIINIAYTYTYIYLYRQTDGRTDRQTDRPTEIQIDRKIDR